MTELPSSPIWCLYLVLCYTVANNVAYSTSAHDRYLKRLICGAWITRRNKDGRLAPDEQHYYDPSAELDSPGLADSYLTDVYRLRIRVMHD